MARPQRVMLTVVFLGLLLWIGLTVATEVGVRDRLPEVGFRVPDFILVALDGRSVTPEALRGRPWLLHFWATWCSWCQKEMPDLAAFEREHPEVTVLWVAVGETAEVVSAHLAEHPVRGPVFTDPDRELYTLFAGRGLPSTVWVDGSGVVRHVAIGRMTPARMTSLLASLP